MRLGVGVLPLAGMLALASTAPAGHRVPAAGGVTFTRVDGKTEVKYGQPKKLLQIDAGGSADFSTDPAASGAQWKDHFHWTVPATIVAGKPSQVTIGVSVSAG